MIYTKMKEKYYNINKSFSGEEENVEAKVGNIEISFEESNSRNHKRFELLNDVNSINTGFTNTAFQNNDITSISNKDNILTKNYHEIEKIDSLSISLNKPDDFNTLDNVSFPKKPIRKKNFISSIETVLNTSYNKKEKIRKLMDDLVCNPERLNTETLYSDNMRLKEDNERNIYENITSLRNEDHISSRDYISKNVLTEKTHSKRDLSDNRRVKVNRINGNLFPNKKGDLSSKSNSPDFEGNSKILNTICINKASYVNKYKNTLVTPYKSKSQEKDKKNINAKPIYENRFLVKKQKDLSAHKNKPSNNKKNMSKRSSKYSFKNKMEVFKEGRGASSISKDRRSRSPENIFPVNKDYSNRNTIDSTRSEKNREFLNISPNLKGRVDDPQIMDILIKIKEQSEKIEKKYSEKKKYYKEELIIKNEKISILEEKEKKYLQEIDDLKYRLNLFVREYKKQNMKYEKTTTNVECTSFLPKTPCESTHLSQSPIIERINHDLQDFKENKSLIEEFDNMLLISDDDDLRFYKENSIPKLKSFTYLLKEFGLDTYIFYNLTEKQAAISKDFVDDLIETETEKAKFYDINCFSSQESKWYYKQIFADYPKIRMFIHFLAKRLCYELNLRLKSEEKCVRLFANDLQNIFYLDEKLKNFEKKQRRTQNNSNLSSLKSI